MRELSRRRRSPNSGLPFFSPRIEALEDRLTPAATFYWKLESASPVLDPDHALSQWNYIHSGSDAVSGSYSETSTLTMSRGPDVAAYSNVYTSTVDPTQTTKVNAKWSGAPNIILPGQVFTITDFIQADIRPNAIASVNVSAYGTTVHGLAGVKLNLFTSKTGKDLLEGSGTGSADIQFTAPKTQNADFPNPVGVTPNKPVAHIVITEYFGFLGNTGANAVQYIYDEVIGTPPAAPTLNFKTPPAGASVGQILAPVVIAMANAPAGSIVTLALGSKPDGAVLSGTVSAPVIGGVATFKGLALNVPGNYTLVASSLGLTTTSRQFQIGDQLKFVEQPLKYVLGAAQITISVVGIGPDGKVDPLLKLSDVNLTLLKNGVTTAQPATAKVTNGVIQYTLSFSSTGEQMQLVASSAKAFANATSASFADVLAIESVWTGNGTKVAGGNANWDNPLNWDIGQKPQSGAGQSLIFPSNAINKAPIDNMLAPANTNRFTIGDISISGNYRIAGTQPLAIAGNITASAGSDAHLAIADLLFANPATLTAGSNSQLTLEGTKGTAGQMMTVQGTGTIVLNSPVANDVILPGGTNGSGNLEFGQKLQGAGRVIMNGGTLKGGATNNFQGLIQVAAGTIAFAPSSTAKPLNSPLGVGSLVFQSAGGTITIDAGAKGAVNLSNKTTYDLQQGKTLFPQGTLTFVKPVVLKSSSEIDPASAAVVGITDLSSDMALANLALAGAGTTNLLGALTATVLVSGKVKLAGKFAGTGQVVLTDHSSALESTLSNTFKGAIDVQKGTILLGGSGPLGTGDLNLGSAGQVVTVKVATSATLTNAHLTLDGTTVAMLPSQATKGNSFTLNVAGTVQVKTASTFQAPSGTNSVNFKGAIAGAALALECTAVLGGTLSAPLTIHDGGSVALDTKFGGTGNLTVQGGMLSSVNHVQSYTGSISLVSGVISLGSATANLGVGAFSLLGGTLRLPVAIATLTNVNVVIGGSVQISAYTGKTPIPVAGGKLKIAAPILFSPGSEIDPLTGTIVTLSGALTGSVKVGGKGEIDRPKSAQSGDLASNTFTLLAGAKVKYI